MNQLAIPFETTPIVQARAVGEIAAELAAGRAERKTPGFGDAARAHILEVLKLGPASGEALTDSCKAAGIAPIDDDRAFGAVFGTLVRRGQIRCVGFVPRSKGHGTAGGRVWRLAR